MAINPDVRIVEVSRDERYERFLYRCLAPMPFRIYKKRREYLETAVPQGFRKKILFFKGDPVGAIEYAPAKASGYPIMGDNLVVLHCFWVLRKVKGHRFGTLLIKQMIQDHQDAEGFATLGFEQHWSPWLQRAHIELYGFKSIDSITVSHKLKHVGERFFVHLMWFSNKRGNPPFWNKERLLQGIGFCMAHPLYHPEHLKTQNLLEEC